MSSIIIRLMYPTVPACLNFCCLWVKSDGEGKINRQGGKRLLPSLTKRFHERLRWMCVFVSCIYCLKLEQGKKKKEKEKNSYSLATVCSGKDPK